MIQPTMQTWIGFGLVYAALLGAWALFRLLEGVHSVGIAFLGGVGFAGQVLMFVKGFQLIWDDLRD